MHYKMFYYYPNLKALTESICISFQHSRIFTQLMSLKRWYESRYESIRICINRIYTNYVMKLTILFEIKEVNKANEMNHFE